MIAECRLQIADCNEYPGFLLMILTSTTISWGKPRESLDVLASREFGRLSHWLRDKGMEVNKRSS